MKILSLCTSAGLWDKAWLEAGHEVVAGCEIEKHKRDLYESFCGGTHLCNDISDLPEIIAGQKFDGVIGGIPCQSFSKLKSIRSPKFPDLTSAAMRVLSACKWDWFLFENVVRLNISAPHTHTR